MKIINVNDIYNKFISASDYNREDDRYWSEIRSIAQKIESEREEKPILLLSGPSGSGKTTTANRIEKMLEEYGMETHTISLDCYFSTLAPELVKSADLESPNRLDKDLLQEHIYKLLNYEEIELPEFDFANTRQIKSGVKLRRKPDEIIIVEGIDALNPQAVSVERGASRMYISVRTRLSYGDGKILHPRFIRLLRRMSRDMRFRGRLPYQTLSYFESVERGVDKYVSPYKIYADYSIDTFIEYEPLVYRDEMLKKLSEERSLTVGQERVVIDMLIEFLSSYTGRTNDLVSDKSLIREFIGDK
jgi:uridine kinase